MGTDRITLTGEQATRACGALIDLGNYNEGEPCWCPDTWWETRNETGVHTKPCDAAREALALLSAPPVSEPEKWPCGCVKGETPHGAGWRDCQFQPPAPVQADLAERQAALEDCAEALRLYAEPQHWDEAGYRGDYTLWEWDGGCEPPWKRAEDALARLSAVGAKDTAADERPA